MEGLRSPYATKWLLAAGGRGWTTSSGTRGEGGARCRASRVLHLRSPSGTHHGGFSPIFLWRRATTVAPAFAAQSSPFSAFPSADKPEKADADTETPKVQTQTASELPKPAAENEEAAAEIQNQTESELLPMAAAKTENAQVVQSQTATESLEAGAETETTQVQTHTPSESLQASAEAETVQVETTQTPSEPETETVQVETQTPNVPTVHVRFVLRKPCRFGEQFLLVGEDPILGLWDPNNAIPLEWSVGHVWAAEVDLPVGEEIKFKFILRALSGKIKWQPGPNRVLQTRETTSTIVVTGDWENAVDQEMTEKGPQAVPAEGKIDEDSSSAGTDGEAVTENDQAAIADGTQENIVGAAEVEKPIVQKGDPVLIPGLALHSISPTEGEGASSEEATNRMVDAASFASGEIGSGTAEEVNV